MRIVIGIDDTDNLTTEKGTGRLLTAIAREVEAKTGVSFTGVVRHQLFVHPSIPYTSHNSAMSVTAETEPEQAEMLLDLFPELLIRDSADGSDPGFCLAAVDSISEQEKDLLIEYGRKAKTEVLSKESAYLLAFELNLHLSEHGGTGHGVIGALAGVGLRLSGSDGRFRGKYILGKPGDITTVKSLLDNTKIDYVQDLSGRALPEDEMIKLGEKVKGVLLDNQKVLLVVPNDKTDIRSEWQTCPMEYLREHY